LCFTKEEKQIPMDGGKIMGQGLLLMEVELLRPEFVLIGD